MSMKSKARRTEATKGHYLGAPVILIPLTGGKSAMVDPEEWPRIKRDYGAVWFKNSNGQGRVYARRMKAEESGQAKLVTLQRAVLDAKQGQKVRVHSGDALDCRKVNLAFMTQQEQKQLWRVHAG